jgi:histone H2B
MSQRRHDRGYQTGLYRVLKQVHPDMGVTKRGMALLQSFVADVFERIAREAGRLARYNGRRTLTAREVQSATRLVLRGELANHAVAEGTRAVTKYQASFAV